MRQDGYAAAADGSTTAAVCQLGIHGSNRTHQDWPPISDFNSGPQSVPEPPVRLEEGSSGLVGRIALFVTFAATVALLIIFAKPLSQLAIGLFEAYSGSGQATRTNRLAANPTVCSRASFALCRSSARSREYNGSCSCGECSRCAAAAIRPRTAAGAAGPASAIHLTNATGRASGSRAASRTGIGAPKNLFRGVTDNEIRFGISAPFSGAAKELGQNMQARHRNCIQCCER